MSAEQKRAWFVLGVIASALTCFLVLIPLIGMKPACGAFGLLGLTGLMPLLFRKKGDAEEVALDERDGAILAQATLLGGMTSYVAFVLACMASWFIYYMFQGETTISIHVLPMMVGVAAIVLLVVRAITILVLYGREACDGED